MDRWLDYVLRAKRVTERASDDYWRRMRRGDK